MADDLDEQLADARHELDVLRGIATDLEQRLDLALTDCARALAERDEARRAAASWEEWGQAEGSRTARDKAWAELDQVRAELAKTVSNFEEFAEAVADRRRPTEAAPGALDLDRLKALADAATAGPWYRAKNHSRASVADPDNAVGAFDGPRTRYIAVVGDGGRHCDTDEQSNADAAFIAAAREAVPTLIAALERERTEHAQWAFDAGHATGEYLRQVEERHSADLAAARAERDRAVAHDRQPYPTADAYEAACAALEKHRERAERAEAERDRRGDELRRAQGVIEAAKAWRGARPGRWVALDHGEAGRE